MDQFLAKANIEHFKKLLASETDAHKRLVLENLLAEEGSKLAAALRRLNESKGADQASFHSRRPVDHHNL
jgi:hypothetical protein